LLNKLDEIIIMIQHNKVLSDADLSV